MPLVSRAVRPCNGVFAQELGRAIHANARPKPLESDAGAGITVRPWLPNRGRAGHRGAQRRHSRDLHAEMPGVPGDAHDGVTREFAALGLEDPLQRARRRGPVGNQARAYLIRHSSSLRGGCITSSGVRFRAWAEPVELRRRRYAFLWHFLGKFPRFRPACES